MASTKRRGVAAIFTILGAVVLAALVIGGCAYRGYNSAITLDESVQSSWAQVENQLQRRFDLIPNLVQTVKGYATHESELFGKIADARAAYTGAGNRAGKIEAANKLEGFLSRLLVIREAYPELKADRQFIKLQDQLEGTENRLSVERRRFNEAVKRVNAHCRRFPGSVFCGWAGVERSDYFEVEEEAKEAPKVEF